MTQDEFLKYKLNHEEIDRQHLEIFNKCESIVEFYKSETNKQILLQMISEFEILVSNHFEFETSLMQKTLYPKDVLIIHTIEHKYTLSEIKIFGLRQHISFDSPYPIQVLTDIIISHVHTCDKDFVDWLHRQN